MIAVWCFVAVATFGAPHAARPAADDSIRFEFRPLAAESATRDIGVRLIYRTGADTVTAIRLPGSWAGYNDHYHSITDIRSGSPSVRIEASSAPDRWIVHAPAHEVVTVDYRVHQDWTGPLRRPQYFRAIARPDMAVLIGQNALVLPDRDGNDSVVVTVAWRDLPAGWRAASSFGSGVLARARATIADVRDGLFIAGVFRWQNLTVRGRSVELAARTTGRITDSLIARMTSLLIERERRFWNDRGPGFYLAVALPISNGLGGTAFTNAIAMYADSTSRLQGFGETLAHELFHAWIGRRVRMAGDEGLSKWFTEGFTEFYADRFARAVGVITTDGFVQRVNADIREYYTSPARNTPRDSVPARYWTDPAVNRLPYLQGYLLAAHLDVIGHDSVHAKFTLDSAMAALLRRSVRQQGEVTESDFVASFPAGAQLAIRAAIDTFVVAGHTMPVDAAGFGPCMSVEDREEFPFDLGFDSDASTKARVVSGVRPGSAAEQAGLRDGMRLTRWGWFGGQADSTVKLTVSDSADSTRVIAYLPRATTSLRLPRLVAEPCPTKGRGGNAPALPLR